MEFLPALAVCFHIHRARCNVKNWNCIGLRDSNFSGWFDGSVFFDDGVSAFGADYGVVGWLFEDVVGGVTNLLGFGDDQTVVGKWVARGEVAIGVFARDGLVDFADLDVLEAWEGGQHLVEGFEIGHARGVGSHIELAVAELDDLFVVDDLVQQLAVHKDETWVERILIGHLLENGA